MSFKSVKFLGDPFVVFFPSDNFLPAIDEVLKVFITNFI